MNNNINNTSSTKSPLDYSYIILIASTLVFMVCMGMFFSVGVFFKPILNEFGWTRAVTSGPIAMAAFTTGVLAIAAGSLTDKIGPRIVTTFCGLIMGTGYILVSHLTSIWQLYIFYGLLIGAGISVNLPLMSTVARWFGNRKTFATGIMMGGGAVGGMFIPIIASWLISTYSWRTALTILGIAIIVLTIILAQFLKRDPSCLNKPAQNVPGARQSHSLLEQGSSVREAVNSKRFWLILFSFFCFGFTINLTMMHLVPHVTDMNISAADAALVLAVLNAVSIPGRSAVGIMGDKLGNKRLYIMALILQGLAFIWLIYAGTLGSFFVFAAMFGLSFGAGITQQSPLIASVFGMKSHGITLGMAGCGHATGLAVGGFLGGYFFDMFGSYQIAFIVCVILCVVSILLMSPVKPLTKTR